MRLNELNQHLFGMNLSVQHNAFSDASATKDCFFALRERGLLNENEIEQQQDYFRRNPMLQRSTLIGICILLIIALISLIILYLFHYK